MVGVGQRGGGMGPFLGREWKAGGRTGREGGSWRQLLVLDPNPIPSSEVCQ